MGFKVIVKKISGQKRGKIEKKWEFQAGSSLLSTPTSDEIEHGKKVIVFGTKDGKIYTIDNEARVKWLFDIQEKRGEVELLFLDEETVKSIRCAPTLADINDDG